MSLEIHRLLSDFRYWEMDLLSESCPKHLTIDSRHSRGEKCKSISLNHMTCSYPECKDFNDTFAGQMTEAKAELAATANVTKYNSTVDIVCIDNSNMQNRSKSGCFGDCIFCFELVDW